jgi:hypothetical protein
MGHTYDKSADWSSGANSTSPEADQNFGTNSTLLEPNLRYLLPVNLAGGHSFNYDAYVYEFWRGLGHDLRWTSASLEPDFRLDIGIGKGTRRHHKLQS